MLCKQIELSHESTGLKNFSYELLATAALKGKLNTFGQFVLLVDCLVVTLVVLEGGSQVNSLGSPIENCPMTVCAHCAADVPVATGLTTSTQCKSISIWQQYDYL